MASRSENRGKTGDLREQRLATYTYDNVKIPAENLFLAEKDQGFKVAMIPGRRANRDCGTGTRYRSRRIRKSSPLFYGKTSFLVAQSQLQSLQFMVADMATRPRARMLVWRAAWLKDQKQRCTRESAMAKVYASEAAISRSIEHSDAWGLRL